MFDSNDSTVLVQNAGIVPCALSCRFRFVPRFRFGFFLNLAICSNTLFEPHHNVKWTLDWKHGVLSYIFGFDDVVRSAALRKRTMCATSTLLSFLALFLIAGQLVRTQATLSEVDILTELYTATSGASWLSHENWTVTDDPCSWEWVSCTRGKVRKLKLEFNNLNGTLPSSIGSLDSSTLTYLSVHHNALEGTLPPSIASLTSLKTLYAANNAFTGILPRSYGSLDKLGRLFVSSNKLEGTVPVCYGSLKNLYRAMFSDNENLKGSSLPSGELPPSFRSLERLVQLNGPLARNQFWPRGIPKLAATAHNNATPTFYAGKYLRFGGIVMISLRVLHECGEALPCAMAFGITRDLCRCRSSIHLPK